MSKTKKTIFINIGIFLWCTAIIAWVATYTYLSIFSFLIAFLSLLRYFFQEKVINMFGKKTPQNLHNEKIAIKTPIETLEIENKSEKQDDKVNTVIAHDVVFDGNIKSSQPIYIYGKVCGDITAENNIVKVMLNGEVTGNILSHVLIINGKVNGECHSEEIKIEDKGEIKGTIYYSTLEIKKGGIFIGNGQLALHKKEIAVADMKKRTIELKSE